MHQKKSHPPKHLFQERKLYHHRQKKFKQEEQPEVACYGCGIPGVIKLKNPNCKGKDRKTSDNFSSIVLQSASMFVLTATHRAAIRIINGVMGTACADTAVIYSIAVEILYHIFEEAGSNLHT